jgi:hypothetical protein
MYPAYDKIIPISQAQGKAVHPNARRESLDLNAQVWWWWKGTLFGVLGSFAKFVCASFGVFV